MCENPKREYTVSYTPGDKFIDLNGGEAKYPVLVDDNRDENRIVTATTPNAGPTARLFLRPYLKMEFWKDGALFQTDGCYSTKPGIGTTQ